MSRGDYALAIDRFEELRKESSQRENVQSSDVLIQGGLGLLFCHAMLGEYDRAQIQATTLRASSQKGSLPHAAVNAVEGWMDYLQGRSEDALSKLEGSLSELRALGSEEWVPDCARWLGYVYRSRGRIQDAIRCMYESIGAAERRGELASAARTKSGLARLYRNVGRFNESRELLLESLEVFQGLGSASMTQRIALDLAVLSRLSGQLEEARSYSKTAIAIAEENHEELSKLLYTLSLARVEQQLGNLSIAQELVAGILEIAAKNNYFHPHVLALEDRGDLAVIAKEYSEALADYISAFDLLETKERGEFPGELAWRIGLCHLHLRNMEEAQIWIERGLDICRRTGDAKEQAVTVRAQGVLFLHQGNVEGGLKRIRESLDGLRKLGVPFEVGRCHLELAKAAHRFTKARRDFESELEAAEDIFSEIGAGLGLQWIKELRDSASWDDPFTPSASTFNLLTESAVDLAALHSEFSLKSIRFAQTTLGVSWRSPKYLDSLDLLRHFAHSRAPLLLLGETGVGKTAFAEVAHVLGRTPADPFVVVNCASLPETLLESELFGHVRGAFTGAERDKPGLIRSAGLGTIFLDEVDKASASFQANLLHVLDRGEIRAIGSHTFQEVKARFVLATNRDLTALAAEGRFLADLEFRISGLRIVIPPLRERIEDFDFLLAIALRELRLVEGVAKEMTIEARNFLSSYGWPGNLRELFSVVMAAGLLCDGNRPISMREVDRVFRDSRRLEHTSRTKRGGDLASRMEELEKQELLMTLRLEGGSQLRAAAKLGITRRGLNKKLHRLGLLEQLDREGLEGFSYRKSDPETTPSEDPEDLG